MAVEYAPGSLPSPVSRFIGRERQLEEVASLLGTSRLVALTGAGGSGRHAWRWERRGSAATRLPRRRHVRPVGISLRTVPRVERCCASNRDTGESRSYRAGERRVGPSRPAHAARAGQPGAPDRGGAALGRVAHHVPPADDSGDESRTAAPPGRTGVPRAAAEPRRSGRWAATPRLVGHPDTPIEPDGRPVDPASEALRLFVDRAHAVQPGFALTDQLGAGDR